jgi:hypothetical protein
MVLNQLLAETTDRDIKKFRIENELFLHTAGQIYGLQAQFTIYQSLVFWA